MLSKGISEKTKIVGRFTSLESDRVPPVLGTVVLNSLNLKMTDPANFTKGKLKYFPPQANSKCGCCQEVSKRLETVEKQQNSLLEILAEHKVLLDRLVSKNAVIDNIIQIFPVNTVDKLKELDSLLGSHSDTYQTRTLIAGNVERNLHYVFGQGIILNFNVDGIFGKERLRDYSNVFNTLIDNSFVIRFFKYFY
ncbi:uncharacterized protein LOC124420870 [Lucilia cuprina]|uniref:uncharacterized protein LOC124420870 n=1 Tax=Lucilia cuprina TaxID=7375 RepID=UPI001F05C795|nr:uncharacterized protein LOC124420870 [Lucilia cuprina]